MLLANMEEEESTDESAEDITAALTAPRPRNATHCAERQRHAEVHVQRDGREVVVEWTENLTAAEMYDGGNELVVGRKVVTEDVALRYSAI